MAKKHIKSRPGLFGMVHYYDENGKHIGKSRPGLLEGTRVYTDNDGKRVGKSRPGFFAKEVFIDSEHNRITSYDGLIGEVHYKDGRRIGHTRPRFFDRTYTVLEKENEILCNDYEMDVLEETLTELEEDLTALEEILHENNEEDVDEKEKVTQYICSQKSKPIIIIPIIIVIIACICAVAKYR